MNSQLSITETTRIDRIKNSNLLISSIFQFDTNIEKKFKHEIWEIKKNMRDSLGPISNETSIKIEIIADLITNTVNGIYELDIPEERIISMTREIEEFMLKGEKLKEMCNKKELALKSLSKVNYKVFIPMIPKLGFGSYEYQLRPLFPKYDLNNGEEPFVLIKSYKPKGRRNSSEDNNENEYRDCSGCEPQLVEYCKNCGRVLVNGKHPSKHSNDDHFGSPPSSANLKRELIHMLYTDIYPFIFFTTFIASMFGVGRLWTSVEEKMSFFIGTITNKLIQFRDNLNEELQALFKN